MLTSLRVRHLAVVEDVDLKLTDGMTALTGETGAGKSILIDALSLALGDRADSKMVRQGYKRAEIEAVFATADNLRLVEWLTEQELDDDNQCYCRRTVSADGGSRSYINGHAVPLRQLREVGRRTIDIHGQYAHQSLVSTETQRQLLDTVAGTNPLIRQLSSAHSTWRALKKQLGSAEKTSKDQTAKLELIRYQVNELSSLNLTEDTIKRLVASQKQLSHAQTLINASQSALHTLLEQDEGAAYTIISNALTDLAKLQTIEPRFANMVDILNLALIQLDECNNELTRYLGNTHADPAKLEEIETRLSKLHDLARKHQVEIETLPALHQRLCNELTTLENNDGYIAALQQKLKKAQETCQHLCQKISEKRQRAAIQLAREITRSIGQLAMPDGRIEWRINNMADDAFNETGSDTISLLVSTNQGEKMGELGKIASGGELARISLAVQIATAGSHTVPTFVFDEVDAGIGGGVAEIVGSHLRKLAKRQQVICITHLPQVAVQAHQQIKVSKKSTSDNRSGIDVATLDKSQRVAEIARMLGGITITEKTRSHAQEMLDSVKN